ncbi:hypothetical protein AAF712_002639 [Marasmius tenuissimus]|uniref:F-box protein n=1 Tax=Marasmius tenuissimus TaxID=585030 RepID=A0ABR3AAY2_9AGAR
MGATLFGNTLEDLTRNGMPALENLHLLGGLLFNDDIYRFFDHAIPPEDARTPVAALLAQSHLLRLVHLASEHLEGFLSLKLNWPSLTELHSVSPLTWNDPGVIIPRISMLCPSLTVLRLEVSFERSADRAPITTASLPGLKTLDLSVTRIEGTYSVLHDSLRLVFQRLEVPRLTHFCLVVDMNRYMERDTAATMPFHDLFLRCGSSLTHLTLGSDFLWGDLQRFQRSLELLPFLLSLHVKGRRDAYAGSEVVYWSDAKPLLRLLATEPIPCPLLEELILDGCGADHVDAIIAFASARPRLKALSVKFGAIDDKPGLQIMKSDHVLATLRDLGEVKGVRVDWIWREGPMAGMVFDHPYAGLDGRLVEWYV